MFFRAASRHAELAMANVSQSGDPFPNRLLRRMREAKAQTSLSSLGIGHPLGTGIDGHTSLQSYLSQARGIDVARQSHPQKNSARRIFEFGVIAELRAQALDEHVQLAAQGFAQIPYMTVEIMLTVFGQGHLVNGARSPVILDGENATHERPSGDQIANAQGGRDRFRK